MLFLATEIFKLKDGVSTRLTENIFQFVNKHYDQRNNSILLKKRNRTVLNGTESPSFLVLKIWELILQSLEAESVLISKLKLKHRLPANAHAGSAKNI